MSIDTDDLTTLDERTFGARVEPHRRELHVHCCRLLGSFDDAEDLVQEAFLCARFRDGAVADVVNFSRSVFPHFGLPATLNFLETA